MYQAYKSGLEALQFMHKSKGLTLERAEDVITDLKEAVEDNEEIAAVLSEGDIYGIPMAVVSNHDH